MARSESRAGEINSTQSGALSWMKMALAEVVSLFATANSTTVAA